MDTPDPTTPNSAEPAGFNRAPAGLDPAEPAAHSRPLPEPHGGVEIDGGEVHAGRDIVGGDVINVQRTGFSAREVQRLLLLVGGLVFVTAAVFFVLGATVSVTVLATLNRPLQGESSNENAASMQFKLDQLNALSPGDGFRASFTEEEVSSYFRFVIGRSLGITEGKVRFMDEPGQMAIGGKLSRFGGLEFAAQLNLTRGGPPMVITAAWVKLLPTQNTTFGWVPVTPFAKDLETQLNAFLFNRVRFTDYAQFGAEGSAVGRRVLTVIGVVH